MQEIKGNILDVFSGELFAGKITVDGGKIAKIEKIQEQINNFILPGFVDSHTHIESSMLAPSNFAKAAMPHGTVAVVADVHEISNVLGVGGINFMANDSANTPMKIYFAAPSCVPATLFETSGAAITSKDIEKLMQRKEVVSLGEVMNFRDVLNNDAEIMKKINSAKCSGKPVDGHCPGLSRSALKKYIDAGISTDHECTNFAEAEEKAKLGMKILIREGSSAKNMEQLINIAKHYGGHMFASDDIHADDLILGHMDILLRKAVSLGVEPLRAVRMVTVNPILHYGLDAGLLRAGDPADFVVVNNLKDFGIIETWINGAPAAKNGKPLFRLSGPKIGAKKSAAQNRFEVSEKKPDDFKIIAKGDGNKMQDVAEVNCINAIDGQIVTKKSTETLQVLNGNIVPDASKDVLKIAVISRYGNENKSMGFIKGFGLKSGAIASSIAHDSHNIIAVGADDGAICAAVNCVIKTKGGLAAASGEKIIAELALPIAGLMSTENAEYVSEKLRLLSNAAKSLGCKLHAPFMALSFMALPVIPELKITDKGLFDSDKFEFIDVVNKR